VSDIEALLRRATELAPTLAPAWIMLGLLLHQSDRSEEAIVCYQRAAEIEPDNPSVWSGLGADYAQIGDMEKSADAYGRSVALQPESPGIHMSYAHALKALGRQAEALREYRTAIAQKPDFGEVYWSMANLKVFRFEPAEVAAMEEQVKREDLSPSADVHFRFALGKAYEDARDYDRAWEFYHTGNQRHRPQVSYDPVGFEVRHEELAACSPASSLPSMRDRAIHPMLHLHRGPATPGSTLIEQILRAIARWRGRSSFRSWVRSRCRSGDTGAAACNIPPRCASFRAGTFAPTVSSTSKRRRSSVPPASRASPTSCPTTSRTSVSRT
jgi:Tfp pilus assembly protein PilF